MTIFRLYAENGCNTGFWVQHRSWQNVCGVVRSVAGQERGALPGTPPLHDDATMVLETFDVRSGRPLSLAESLRPDDRNFNRIAKPIWYRQQN